MKVGVDYYPEHWDKSMWDDDADLMASIGVNVVRMAEFAWSRLEPHEGEYDFEWLDEIIEIFAERNIDVVLGTPTSTPPMWLYEKYPETIQMDATEHRIAIGIRGHRCVNSPIYREKSRLIIDKMVSRYVDNKAVIGYQIDNELEANFCFCPVCEDKFRDYLRNRYKTIEAVNKAYGNDVWSGEYSDFSQIRPPFGQYPKWLNPSYMLDYYQFASESTVEYAEFQNSLIRQLDSKALVTTNTWMCEHKADFNELFKNLDFVSYDNYPTTIIPNNSEELYSHAFHLDLMRGIKQSNFWIMEQLSGSMGCWMPMTPAPRPGMIKGYALQAVAHGADAVLHFRWRSARSGAEMFWHGVLDASNIKGRRFEEFADLCAAMREYSRYDGTTIRNEVAILHSARQEYAFRIQLQMEGIDYYSQLKQYHDALTCLGVGVDIIDEKSDLSQYKLVIAPTLFITDESQVNRIYSYVANGGTLVLTNRSGVKDEYNKCLIEPLPGPYSKLVGAIVEEYDPVGYRENELDYPEHLGVRNSRWADILKVDSAEVIARYGGEYYAGKPAITLNNYELGNVYYVGTLLNRSGVREFMKDVIAKAQVCHVEGLPVGVEWTVRSSENADYNFIFNNTETMQEFDWRIVCGDNEISKGHIQIQPFEMAVNA